MKRKSAVLKAKKTSEIVDRDLGESGDNEVIIKNWYCTLCTTDYQRWMGLREHQGYPTIGGCENSAKVVKTGKKVRSVEFGDKVAIAYDFCRQCRSCLLGYTYACKNVEKPQISEDRYYGFLGLSNYQKVKDHMLIKLSRDVSLFRRTAFNCFKWLSENELESRVHGCNYWCKDDVFT